MSHELNGTGMVNFHRPEYTKPYKPTNVSLEFFSWVNLSIRMESNRTPKMHFQMIDYLLGSDHINMQALVHRGGAKSTVMTNYLPLYAAVTGGIPNFGHVENIVIFSATIGQAIEQLQKIKNMWMTNEVLYEFLTLAKDPRGKIIADKVDYICFENRDGHITHLQAVGSGESMRGTSKTGAGGQNVRPQLLIFDDILKDEILTSELARKNLKTWFYSTVQNSIDIEHYKKIIVGTPMHLDDLLMNMARSPEYRTVMFPVADIFPVPEDEIVSSWKDRFTPKRIMNLFREAKGAGAEADFYREMMLEVVNDDMRIFEEKWFKPYQYKEFKSKLGECNIFTTMDLAVSQKKSGDFTVIITIAVNGDGHWFIIKIDVGRFTPTETIDRLFQHVIKFKPLFVKAEKAALQQVLDHYIQERMMATGTYFNYDPLVNNSVISKELRINALQPKMKMGHIHFPTDIDQDALAELKYEMMGYIRTGPTTAHDDCVDCLGNFLDPDFVIVPNAKSGTEVKGDMYDFDFDDDIDNSYNL